MRPKATKESVEVYECYGCGNRVNDPSDGFCATCGSEVRNIGKPRDL